MSYLSPTSMSLSHFSFIQRLHCFCEEASSSFLLSSSHTSFFIYTVIVQLHYRQMHLINATPLKDRNVKNINRANLNSFMCPSCVCNLSSHPAHFSYWVGASFLKVLWHHPRHHPGHQIWHVRKEVWAEDRQCSICGSPYSPSASSDHSGKEQHVIS